jgi:cyclase
MPRITPCLLLHDRGLTKTVKFGPGKYIGDPINAVRIFNEKEADELILIDIDATVRSQSPDFGLIERVAAECRMPMCYGGGITSLEHAKQIIDLGVEKVALSSAAIANPNLITDIATEIGTQSVVVVLDVKKRSFGRGYNVVTHNATRKVGTPFGELVSLFERMGAGEIVVNSVDMDGTMLGYDLDAAREVQRLTNLPLTILGGAGSLDDIAEALASLGVAGFAAGSMFVFKGPYRAVLINYPSRAVLDDLIGSILGSEDSSQ